MKLKAASVIIVTLLLTGTLASIFATTLVLAKTETSEEKEPLLNDDVQLARNATKHTKEEIEEQVNILEHEVTTLELEQLKGATGVWKENENYNQIINGHGTGLCPPTEDEWKRIADDMYIVDKVTYPLVSASVDLSATPWFPPIGDQDGEGSCVAFAVGYYTKTFQEAKEHGWDLSGAAWEGGYHGHPTQSYQNRIISPDFIYHLTNGGVDGGLYYEEAVRLVCFVGACSWEKMPNNPLDYTTWPSEEAWTEAPWYRGDSSDIQYMYIDSEAGLTNLKNLIASGNLAMIRVDSHKYSYLTEQDLWTTDNYVNPSENHANTVVGYDDNKEYMENGETHYGAFKIANSWGVGGWEQVPDGFYWISYEAMKQQVWYYCMFYYDMVGYKPELAATFRISHEYRSECDITVGVGDSNTLYATKRFNDYVDGGAHPFCPNKIVFDVTEFTDVLPSIYGQTYYLFVYDSWESSTTGTIESFAIGYAESVDPPLATVNGAYVYAKVLLTSAPSIEVWTDKSSYSVGEMMSVYLRFQNPGAAMNVRVIIKLELPGGSVYGPVVDVVGPLAAGVDATVLWDSFPVQSGVGPGTYTWIVELRNPNTNALIDSDEWAWTLQPLESASIEVWTDKTSYSVGEMMSVYLRFVNPGAAMNVRVIIKLELPGGSVYGPVVDVVGPLAAGVDATVLWDSFPVQSGVGPGTYTWIVELRNPNTNALIDSDEWAWTRL